MVMNEQLVNMSAACSVLRTYLMELEWSLLILSNNQSKSTRCVREACLELGLSPSHDHTSDRKVVLRCVHPGW